MDGENNGPKKGQQTQFVDYMAEMLALQMQSAQPTTFSTWAVLLKFFSPEAIFFRR